MSVVCNTGQKQISLFLQIEAKYIVVFIEKHNFDIKHKNI